MATPTLAGMTTVNACDNTTGWDTTIGGGPGASANTDIFIEGTGSIARRISGNDRGFGYDVGSGNEWAVLQGQAEEFEHLWFWVNILQPGSINSMRLRLNSSTTDPDAASWAEYRIFPDNPYNGGWYRACWSFALFTSKGAAIHRWAESGNLDETSIRWFAFMFDMATVGGTAQNCLIDIIHQGPGLTVTGGTTADKVTWADIAAVDKTNSYGVVQERSGVFFVAGNIEFGNGTGNCYFEDTDAIVVWESKLTGVDSGTPTTLSGTDLAFNGISFNEGTGTVDFINGIKFGSGDDAIGTNGCIYRAASTGITDLDNRVTIDCSGAITNIEMFGNVFSNILSTPFSDGSITFSSDATDGPNHEISGCTFSACGAVDLGRVSAQGNAFVNTRQPEQFVTLADTRYFDNSTTTYNIHTTNAASAASHDFIPVLTANGTANDIWYFGAESPIARLRFFEGKNSQLTPAAGAVTWEYWNGTSWTALSGVTVTRGTTASFLGIVSWTIPTDSARTTVDTSASLHFVRARITTGHTTISPSPSYSWVVAELLDGAALKWNANIDIANSIFGPNADSDANDEAHGIEHDTAGTFTYTGLTFSGNDADILFTPATGNLTIEANAGSDPSTSTITGSGTVTININSTTTLIDVIGVGGEPATEIRVYDTGTTTELIGQENVTTGSFAFLLNSSDFVDIRVHNVEYVYIAFINFDVPATDTIIPLQQQFDRTYSNP
jgi:hypothetical protein